MYCFYVYIVLCFVGLLLVALGRHFAPWGDFAPLLGAFGAPGAPKGVSLASLWLPFGSLGAPWSHLGHLGLPRGAWTDFG